MTSKTTSALLAFGLAISAWSVQADDKWDISKVDVTKLPPAAAKKDVTYATDIRPLLEASCFRCHGEKEAKAELRLDSLDSVLLGGEDGKMVIPGDSKKSLLVAAAAQITNEIAMPPKRKPGGKGGQGGPGNRPPGGPGRPGGQGRRGGPPPKPLTTEQVSLIRAWIDQGAK